MAKMIWGNPYTHEEHERETMANTTPFTKFKGHARSSNMYICLKCGTKY